MENCFALSEYLNVCVEDILICEDEISSSVLSRLLLENKYKNICPTIEKSVPIIYNNICIKDRLECLLWERKMS